MAKVTGKKFIEKSPEVKLDMSEWLLSVPVKGNGEVMGEDDVAVSFLGDRKGKRADKVMIRLGRKVLDELGWKYNDKISVYNHKDDLMRFILVKREAGYKLKTIEGTTYGQFTYTWRHKLPLFRTMQHIVEHEVDKLGYLVFRAKMSMDDAIVVD